MERVRQQHALRAVLLAAVISACFIYSGDLRAQIEITIDTVGGGIAGNLIQVPITIDNPSPGYELGALDLLLMHPASLALQGSAAGGLLNTCHWEYFSQRIESGGALRIMAVADISNGPTHPSCYATGSGELARISYMVLLNQAQQGDFIPIKWWWYSCGSNSLSDRDGYVLMISDDVYDYDGSAYQDITASGSFPTMHGAPTSCGSGGAPRIVDFYNGGIRMAYVDTEPPIAVCPGDIEQSNDSGQCGAIVTWEASVTDNCPGATVSCSPVSGSYFPVGVSGVTCSAVDTAGNYDTCSFQVTVSDTEYPTTPTQSPITVNNTPGQCGAVVTYQPSATDNCPGLTMQCYPASGSYFQVGTKRVIAVVADASGNRIGNFFTVTVRDAERPVLSCSGDTTLFADPGQCGMAVSFNVSATDNCSAATVVATPPSGSTFSAGVTPVTVVATDSSGNADTCTFSVTVVDSTVPEIVCPDNIAVQNDSASYGAVVHFELIATDNCGVAFVEADPEPGSLFPLGVTPVQIVAADEAGLVDTCSFTVTVALDDADGDGRPSWDDNCPLVHNPEQTDADLDGAGDVCDECTDLDDDSYGDPGYPANTCALDNCPSISNSDQADADFDGIGDRCDLCTDTDKDGFGDPGYHASTCVTDNCPSVSNPDQSDADGDSIGDVCDECTDTDRDGFANPGYAANTCPEDNCPAKSNPDQADADGDGIGDVCDECTDLDNDGFGNPEYSTNTCAADNCPALSNPDQVDADLDGAGDVCDECTDTDNDGFGNPGYALNACALDNCPDHDNSDQTDTDADGVGDACCCQGPSRGNLDASADGLITMGDLTMMIDKLFINPGPAPCPAVANLDLSADGLMTMGDLTVMIDHLFITLSPLPACP